MKTTIAKIQKTPDPFKQKISACHEQLRAGQRGELFFTPIPFTSFLYIFFRRVCYDNLFPDCRAPLWFVSDSNKITYKVGVVENGKGLFQKSVVGISKCIPSPVGTIEDTITHYE